MAALVGAAMWRVRGGGDSEVEAYVRGVSVAVGKVHKPLAYRIVSFHRGRADKALIELAAKLGFNGVQFQIEGSNEEGIADFAARDAREHLVDFCHSLGMQVTVWVHELSDLPGAWMPGYLGEISAENAKLWGTGGALDQRYEWILGKAIPNVDGLVLTVVETQERATATPIMLKLVDLVNRKCVEHGKFLVTRTFVWHPEELAEVMGAVEKMPKDMLIMSKAVPQDWQMRGGDAAEIGAVGGRPQIEEFDVAGEYFLKDAVANCMVDVLKRQFDYGVAKGIAGICVRVDRDDYDVLLQPQEVNLWALGMLAAGATDNGEEIWKSWAVHRYGEKAAAGMTAALKPTGGVVAEMLSIGPFTHGDTRDFPPLPDRAMLDQNWQNWQWDKSFVPAYNQAKAGDAEFVAEIVKQKEEAGKLAEESVAELEKVKGELLPVEYEILRTRLLSNQVQLEFRTPMVMAMLHFRQAVGTRNVAQRNAALELYHKDLAKVRAIADRLAAGGPGEIVDYMGRQWPVNVPLGVTPEQLYRWAYEAQDLLRYYF